MSNTGYGDRQSPLRASGGPTVVAGRGALGSAMTELASELVTSRTIKQSRGGMPAPDEMVSNQAATIMTSVSI